MEPTVAVPQPTLANQFPEWQPGAANELCHRALSLIPMPVLYLFCQLGKTQFGSGGILIEDWADDQNPSLSYQTAAVLAQTLALTHIYRYETRQEELCKLLLERSDESPVVVILRRRLGGVVDVQLRTDPVPSKTAALKT